MLVGTISVEKSEKLSRLLEKRGVPHEVLNAKQHTREALDRRPRPVASAPSPSRRTWPVEASTSSSAATPKASPTGRWWPRASIPRAKRAWPRTQRHFERYDAECKAEGDKVRELGGLYVLGTERHESRRIDNQLRGRSGRQGDPGESRFYLSLEDELMRLFATGAMSWVMGKALPDDVPIEAKMVTKAIERAQTTVEQRNARDPQERPQVRRGDERAAQGHLQAPRPDPRRRRPEAKRPSSTSPTRSTRRSTRSALPSSPRSGTSRACVTEIQTFWPTRR